MTREVNYFKKVAAGVWRLEAACRGLHGVHFPDAPVNTPEYNRQIEEAKAICKKCPVKSECFDLALRNNEQSGVWGGEEFPNGGRRHRRMMARLAQIPR